jgi:very-short-patch-repair endonuclease
MVQNTCRTKAEQILADELARRGVRFLCNSPITVASGHTYTPDFLLGSDLIVEVMDSIHWLDTVRTRDMVRAEALRAKGFRILEFLNLDYTHIDAFSNKEEITKEVSLFANSDGGLIILGVEEKDENGRKVPDKITWGKVDLSKEKLESVLTYIVLHKIAHIVSSIIARSSGR